MMLSDPENGSFTDGSSMLLYSFSFKITFQVLIQRAVFCQPLYKDIRKTEETRLKTADPEICVEAPSFY